MDDTGSDVDSGMELSGLSEISSVLISEEALLLCILSYREYTVLLSFPEELRTVLFLTVPLSSFAGLPVKKNAAVRTAAITAAITIVLKCFLLPDCTDILLS